MYPIWTWGLIWRAGFVDLSIRLRRCWAAPKSARVVVDMICQWAHINLCEKEALRIEVCLLVLFLAPAPGEKGCKRLWWTYTTRGGREKERSICVPDVILLWEGTFVDLIFVLNLCEERDSCICGGVNVIDGSRWIWINTNSMKGGGWMPYCFLNCNFLLEFVALSVRSKWLEGGWIAYLKIYKLH
jgi:hypothetical protein